MMQRERRYRYALSLITICVLSACSQASAPPMQSLAADGVSRPVLPMTAYKVLHDFGKGSDGSTPSAALAVLSGKLYGTTAYGGRGGNGTVFRIDRNDGAEKVLHSFGSRPDGEVPLSTLLAVNHVLYGTTEYGGKSNLGTVFTIDASGNYKVIHDFGAGSDGARPTAGLVALGAGNKKLYGTTSAGGNYGQGTVFSIAPTSSPTENVLWSFGYLSDGAAAIGGLVALSDALYGTTSLGGVNGDGVVFEVSTSGAETIAASFKCVTNGRDSVAALVDLGGTLYGTAATGGTATGCGTSTSGDGAVFSVSSGGMLREIYAFGGGSKDGAVPMAPLAAWRGLLFGTTYAGGDFAGGTLFNVSPAGHETVLHSFGNETDGVRPLGGLIDVDRDFYGTTSAGGKYGGGTVYLFNR